MHLQHVTVTSHRQKSSFTSALKVKQVLFLRLFFSQMTNTFVTDAPRMIFLELSYRTGANQISKSKLHSSEVENNCAV